MTPATTFAGRRVALFGLGGSGLATALALQAGGAEVVAWDDSPASLDKARAQGIGTADLRDADWSGFAALVLSPGVPLTHPAPHWTVELAKAAGVEIIGDIELFCRERAKLAPDAPFVAITGTNGKSTTTALVSHILCEAGRDVQMGGNIGTAILSLDPPAPERVHVIEMSSYQIDLTPSLNPTVGVLLNISPDHLDRHGTMENYAAIKERLVAGEGDAIVGIDDEPCRAVYGKLLRADRMVLSASGAGAAGTGFYLQDGTLRRLITINPEPWTATFELLIDVSGISSLRGSHNGQNAAAAVGVGERLLLTHEQIIHGLKTFPGLHHRMEPLARLGHAIFVNDSKATNADSAEKALLSFDRVFWILGGRAKEGGVAALRPYFPKVEKAYLIGEATDEFAAVLDGAVPHARCGTLDRAVAEAAADAARSATKAPVILFSPACASFDQYPNFEVRGDHFRELVRALPGVEMRS